MLKAVVDNDLGTALKASARAAIDVDHIDTTLRRINALQAAQV